MSTSNNNLPALKPLYTRETLNHIEAELANDGENIELRNFDGKMKKFKNLCRGAGLKDVEAGKQATRNIVRFQDERALQHLEKAGKPDLFFPVYPGPSVFHGANRTEVETKERLTEITREFEASEEAKAMIEMIMTDLKGCAVDKVICFGLGTIGLVRQGREFAYWEHAAARVIAKAVQEVSSAPAVALLAQDPGYTDVCKKVLAKFDIQVVEGFGAKGFALVDDDSVVLAHHPNFPLREIIADLARPALITMKAEHPEGITAPAYEKWFADKDSVRSRKMMREYRRVSLAVPKQKIFYYNAWYIKNTFPKQDEKNVGTQDPVLEEK
ncbi:hypothetical protein HD806DRAFT_484973 [Xylariaceae sp. AK1471]|nr:hypothetical protein HD806DRAFT_484973 [Xylariaceae sp. AK1471]